MQKISIYKYCAANEPERVLSMLRKAGFKEKVDLNNPDDLKRLSDALKFHVTKTGRVEDIKDVHPDADFFENVKGFNNAEGDEIPADNVATSTNIGAEASTQSPEKLEDDSKFKLNPTNVLMGVGIGIVAIGLIKVILK